MSFPAKWPGKCADCGERFDKGAEIRYDEEDELVHADPSECAEIAATAPRSLTLPCSKCFLVHRGECF